MSFYGKKRYWLPALLCLFNVFSGYGQHGINSIYSAYGIGDFQMRDQNSLLGMGNVGVAMPSQNSLNETNPASFASIANNRMIFELTFGGLTTKYINENENISAGNFTISRVALGIQLVNPLRTVVGLRKFSNVDYFTTASRDIAGTNQKLLSEIEGTGGLYQLYLANAIKIKKHLSFGITTGFIFGSVNSKESIAPGTTDALIAESNKYYNHASINGGLQYQFDIGKNKFIAGAFYEPQIRLNVLEQNNLQDGTAVVIVAKKDQTYKFSFPEKYGAGFSFTRESFTLSADVIQQSWLKTGYKGADFTTTDAASYSVGIRHRFTRKSIWGQSEGISLYAGFNKENSYLVIRDHQLNSTSITFGATLPNKNMLNSYSFGFKVGSRGEAVYPMVKEKFFEFNVNIALSSFLLKGGVKYE